MRFASATSCGGRATWAFMRAMVGWSRRSTHATASFGVPPGGLRVELFGRSGKDRASITRVWRITARNISRSSRARPIPAPRERAAGAPTAQDNTVQEDRPVLKINQIRMRNLESMIAQFVDDLLQTIREATIEDLRELLLAEPAVVRPSETPRPDQAVRTAPIRSGRLNGIDRRSSNLSLDFSGSPPSVAEITDPESLLSLGGAPKAAREVVAPSPAQKFWLGSPAPSPEADAPRLPRSPRTELLASKPAPAPDSAPEIEADGPVSNVRPLGGAVVRLSDNETLARVSNSGIVIRRRKKA
jgi:hypothetical protein